MIFPRADGLSTTYPQIHQPKILSEPWAFSVYSPPTYSDCFSFPLPPMSVPTTHWSRFGLFWLTTCPVSKLGLNTGLTKGCQSCTPCCPLSEGSSFLYFACFLVVPSKRMNPDCLIPCWPAQKANSRVLIFTLFFPPVQPFRKEVPSYCIFLLVTLLYTFVYTVSFSVLC